MKLGVIIGIAFLLVGYACLYSGIMNLGNGGKGPNVLEALTGSKNIDLTAGQSTPSDVQTANMTGPTPQTTTPNNPVILA